MSSVTLKCHNFCFSFNTVVSGITKASDFLIFWLPVYVPYARTTRRVQTLYDGQPGSPPGVCHIPMAEPFCNRTREASHLLDHFIFFNISKKCDK